MHHRAERLIGNAKIPKRNIDGGLWTHKFDTDTQVIVDEWLDALLEGRVLESSGILTGQGLLLEGQPGHGKTTLAMDILLTFIQRLVDSIAPGEEPHSWRRRWTMLDQTPGYFIRFPELIERRNRAMKEPDDMDAALWRWMHGDEWHDMKRTVGVLVLDDLGREYASRWTEGLFENLLRQRYDRGLPTVITTNVPLTEWGEVYGEPTKSFAHEALIRLPIISPTGDRRV